jgi:hypothetical protein
MSPSAPSRRRAGQRTLRCASAARQKARKSLANAGKPEPVLGYHLRLEWSHLMRRLALAALCLLFSAAVAANQRTPTVIVDISGIGAERVQALKHEARWSAEFGTELLLGVDDIATWLQRDGVREGLGELSPDEVFVRDHVCVHQSQLAPLGVVGGYEVLRQPPSAIRYAVTMGMPGTALPKDGVVAREAANEVGGIRRGKSVATVTDLVAQVDAERWFQTMSALAGFNRNSFSAALPSARDFILSAFEGATLTTEIFNFQMPSITSCSPATAPIALTNPIGIKLGTRFPGEWIVIGAHYDSRNSARCDGAANPQPGANDNASGCAGVIELARVFANVPTDRSIYFMCYSGEEQGLWGSRRYVEWLQSSSNIDRVKHMINLDMLGYDAGGTLDARVETNSANAALLVDYRNAASIYAPELNIITSSNASAGSDHWYFLQAGVPAVFTWENGAATYPHYHLATDIPANMTRARELAGGILKMDVAMLAQLAGVETLFGTGFE